jgi:tetratricopeptide (TPR) repeat protein
MSILRTLWLALPVLVAALGPPAFPQKPALIRDTDTAEGKESAEPSKPKEYSPIEAEKSLQVGNFYYKGKNYDAAIMRYLEALEYQPDSAKAFEALARAYEKNKQYDKAAAVCRDFIRMNPDSPKSGDFRSRLAKLEKK